MSIQILVVEPDAAIRDALRAPFHKHRIEMSVLYGAASLVRRVELEPPSAIVMRAELPVANAYAAIRALRGVGLDIPVILMSRSADVADKIVAFELGADDYLVDPFDPLELIARVRNAMRRRAPPVSALPEMREAYAFGDIEIDFLARRATKRGRDLSLRSSEFALLKVFVTHPMRVLSRTSILGQLGMIAAKRSDRGLDVAVFRLRALIEDDARSPRYIQTVRGRGYIFVPMHGGVEPAYWRDASAAARLSAARMVPA